MKMKKAFIVAFSVLALAGCSTNEAQKAAEEFLEETKATENIDESTRISKDLRSELVENRSQMMSEVLLALGVKDELKFEGTEKYKELSKRLIKLQDKMNYKVTEVKMAPEKESAEILADIEYFDLSGEFERILNDRIDREVVRSYETGKIDGEKFMNDVVNELVEYIDSLDIEDVQLKKTENALSTIHKEKDEWKITSIDDKTMNAITLGMQKVVDKKVSKKLEDAKENLEFFKIERNFKRSVEILKEEFEGPSKVDITNFMLGESKANLSKRISEDLNETVILTEKPSEQENVYYVTLEEGKIVIRVKIEGQDYIYEEE